MPILSVYPSYPLYFDKNGNPLENGSIYVGTAGSNAVNNQIQAYFDDAKTITASQPIRTKAGYPINPSTGDRVMIYVDVTDFSLVVNDKNGVTIIEENNITDLTYKSASASDNNATDIATNTADIATNTANIATNTSNISTNTTKLAGIEAGADVTDATNVNAAGATMNTDTSLAGNSYFLDEDTMSSNDATKVPSQQSVKAYVDTQITANAFSLNGTIGAAQISASSGTPNQIAEVTGGYLLFFFHSNGQDTLTFKLKQSDSTFAYASSNGSGTGTLTGSFQAVGLAGSQTLNARVTGGNVEFYASAATNYFSYIWL